LRTLLPHQNERSILSKKQYYHMKHKITRHSLAITSGILTFSCSSQAAILANFTDGTGTTLPDQYAGVAGSGWLGAWGTNNGPTVAVSNTSPVNSGGNYLNVTSSVANDTAVGRRFDGTSAGVDITVPVTFTFDLRVDTLTGFDTVNDYLSAHANSSAAGTNYNVSSNSSYIIRAYGASPSAGKNANEWLFYNGAGDGGSFSAANFQNSGMTVGAGTTYSFTVTNDPATKKYSVSIFDGTNTVSSSNLGWRSSSASNGIAFNNRASAVTDVESYSIDNISIVPEPGTVTLVGLAGLAVLRRRRVG
jgi:hypothetical protein